METRKDKTKSKKISESETNKMKANSLSETDKNGDITSEALFKMITEYAMKRNLRKFWEGERNPASQKLVRINIRIIKYAALIIVIAGLLSIFLFHRNDSFNILQDKYLEYPIPALSRDFSSNDAKYDSLFLAFEWYKADELFKSILILRRYTEDSLFWDESRFYLGLSLLKTRDSLQIISAIDQFEFLITSNNKYQDASLWFQAISFYMIGQNEMAKKLFSQIAETPGHFKKDQSVRILKEAF